MGVNQSLATVCAVSELSEAKENEFLIGSVGTHHIDFDRTLSYNFCKKQGSILEAHCRRIAIEEVEKVLLEILTKKTEI